MDNISTDILIVGGGLGGIAAALSALRMNQSVVLVEDSPWLGGQLTAQGVPPDESPWVDGPGESGGSGGTWTYRKLREGIRAYYRRYYPLTAEASADSNLNPGAGNVSPLCHEPRVAVSVIDALLAPHLAAGTLKVYLGYRADGAELDGDRVTSVAFRSADGRRLAVGAQYALDATDLGDLLPLTGAEHAYGAESSRDTGEPHAVDGDAEPGNQQSFTWCFVVDYRPGEEHVIEKPKDYQFWRDYRPDFWPDKLLSWTTPDPLSLEPIYRPIFTGPTDDERGSDLWHYRRILYRKYHESGFFASDLVLANWPQIDYWLGPLVGVSNAERERHLEGARSLSLSMLHWMQTEAPRPEG
ncbi:MAG TPA: FAD-dependent oxidoreductase, partial [Spirochaetia bacterium]|nr:FAD-dependent oxidoreductase [Spirochaetia bacterium]